MKRGVFFLITVLTGVAVFGFFGICCAILYKIADFDAIDIRAESSPKLSAFLFDDSAKTALFSAAELRDGIAGLLFSSASATVANSGGVVVVPSLPDVRESIGGICVVVPASFKTALGTLRTGFLFDVSADGCGRLLGAHIGSARLPSFAARIAARYWCGVYGDFLGSETFGRISSLKFEKYSGKYKLSK